MRPLIGDALSADELDQPPADVGSAELTPWALRELIDSNPREFRQLCLRLARWPIVTDTDTAAVAAYLRRGPMSVIDPDRGVSGELGREFQVAVGLSRRHAITFNSATNALHAAYRALGVGPGTRVAAIGYTFHATVTPILDLGGHPILMDVDPTTGNLRYDDVRRTLEANPDVQVVAMNHNWGLPCQEIQRISEFLKMRSIALVEDCSHAHGAVANGQSVGTHGTIAVFSLQGKKLVPAGEGGLAYTDEAALKSAMLLVGHNFTSTESHVVTVDESVRQTGVGGLQFRMHPLAAALARSQLRRLPAVIGNRHHNEDRLRRAFSVMPFVSFPEVPEDTRASHYACRARYDADRNDGVPIERFVAELTQLGIPVDRDRGGPLSGKTIYRQSVEVRSARFHPTRRLYTDDDLPNATRFCRDALVLPVFSRGPAVMSAVLDVITEQLQRATSGPS